MYPPAIRADPGRAITYAPFVVGKTFGAYLKAAHAAPAKRFFLPAAMTPMFFASLPSLWPFWLCRHDYLFFCSSFSSHAR